MYTQKSVSGRPQLITSLLTVAMVTICCGWGRLLNLIGCVAKLQGSAYVVDRSKNVKEMYILKVCANFTF